MHKYVVGFLFDKDNNNVVLIRKLKPEFIKGMLNGLGGTIEEGELPEQAMTREFEEEAWLKVPQEAWKYKFRLYKPDTYEMHVFKANSNSLIGVKTREIEEVSVYATTSVLHPSNYLGIVPNLKWIIPMLLDDTIQFGKQLSIEEK